MKKILLITFGIIIVAVLGFVTFVSLRGIPKYEAKDPGFTLNSTPEKVAEGHRIASMLCKDCHLDPATGTFSGFNINKTAQVEQFGDINSANITADKKFGIGEWTDGQIAWLLRTGIRKDGQYIPPYMPKFVNMSDEDLECIIAFLRSDDPWVKPTAVASIPSSPSFLTKFLSTIAFFPNKYPTAAIASPDTSKKATWGKYLVTGKYDCYPCHSADFKTMNTDIPEQSAGFMGGGNQVGATPKGKLIYTANLTPDEETGIGKYTFEQFDNSLRNGIRVDKTTNRQPMMPYSNMTEAESRAIYEYLKTIPKISNKINRELD